MPAYPSMKRENWRNPGYSIEATAGVDPATARLAIPGLIDKFVPNVVPRKERGWSTESRDPTSAWLEYIDFNLDIEYQPFDEFNAQANSLLAIALGAAPDVNGVIALLDVLRTVTWQWGWVNLNAAGPTSFVWKRAKYCVCSNYTLMWANGKPTRVLQKWIGIHDPATDELAGVGQAPWGAVPAQFTGSQFQGSGSVTPTVSAVGGDPALTFNGKVTAGTFSIDNEAEAFADVAGSGSPVAGAVHHGDRNITGSLSIMPVDLSPYDLVKKDPQTAPGRFKLVLLLSKNAGAQYIRLEIPKAMLVDDPGVMKYDREKSLAKELEWRWESFDTILADVKQ